MNGLRPKRERAARRHEPGSLMSGPLPAARDLGRLQLCPGDRHHSGGTRD